MGTERYKGITKKQGNELNWTGEVRLVKEAMDLPLRWKRPRRIFVNSMSDLFHESVPSNAIDRIFAVMLAARQHQFQVLTKRPARMAAYLKAYLKWEKSPLSERIWIGVSIEDQNAANERLPILASIRAERRWVSLEPLLGRIDLQAPFMPGIQSMYPQGVREHLTRCMRYVLNWVVVGGESGHNARPMNPEWACDLRDQCKRYGVPFFFKQWGEYNAEGKRVGKKEAGLLLDGVEWSDEPTATI